MLPISAAAPEQRPPRCRNVSVSTTKDARTSGISEVTCATISLADLPSCAITAASITSRPMPVERLWLSTTWMRSDAPSSAAASTMFAPVADILPEMENATISSYVSRYFWKTS